MVTVAWGRDPKTYKAIPVAMVQAKADPAPATSGPAAFCGCGYSRPVPPAEKNLSLRCPRCGNLMAVDRLQGRSKDKNRTKLSAPLLPLHVRAPMKTLVKQGAPHFECICGMRILIRAGSEAGRIQCPQCDRFHTLEVGEASPPAAVKERPAPPPSSAHAFQGASEGKPVPLVKPKATAPPPPPSPSRALNLGEFLCECGEIQPPRTSRTGREFVCKKCGRKGRVETDKDPETGLPVMRPVFTAGPAPSSAPTRGGASEGKAAPGNVSFEELAPMDAPSAWDDVFETAAVDAPPTVDADAQVVPCECGAEILLSATDVGHTIQCPACADTMVVEGNKDPRTGAMKMSLRIVGELDDPDWKLDEFQ